MRDKISKKSIRRAGDNLAAGLLSGDEKQEALDLVGHWRAAHIEPLHRTLAMLESICSQDSSTILVSRLKRIDTTINKLNRPGYNFNLITLRDIAGCRLIVPTESEVVRIAALIEETEQCHQRIDHMAKPKSSGYRGIHLVCRHDSSSYGYENMDVEAQVRSRLQHDWATAVEIYDLITDANLKFDNGSENQKRYFKLASDLMSHAVEDEASAREELRNLDAQLDVLGTLQEASDSMYVIFDDNVEISRSDSCLISVDLGVQQITLEIYNQASEEEAAAKYTELESNAEAGDVFLLARAASLEDLRRAYPNYYSDISEFVGWLSDCIG
ncbi:MAG: RelA/SpoT domain-containing protein [Coriobacteriaceae bacterium]|nr:RelA/SpoT domain-containing protein [Coriobacteriaceae bacterium]